MASKDDTSIIGALKKQMKSNPPPRGVKQSQVVKMMGICVKHQYKINRGQARIELSRVLDEIMRDSD